MAVPTIQRRFLDYQALDGGLKLPTRQTDHIAGQTEVYREVTFDTVTVNDTIDDSLFGGN